MVKIAEIILNTVRPRYNESLFNEFFTYEQKIWIPIFL
jgi:hypothetical protein